VRVRLGLDFHDLRWAAIFERDAITDGDRPTVYDASDHAAPAHELALAIRRTMAGERVVDPGLAAAALSSGISPLSDREREVLVAGQNGASIADIAKALFLSEGTVRNYLSSAIQKLEVSNRTEAARVAEDLGWL